MFDVKTLKCNDFPNTRLGQRVFSTKEIAEFLGVNVYEIRRDIKNKKLKAYKNSTQYFVLESDLEKYINSDK